MTVKVIGYCYHLAHIISFSPSQSVARYILVRQTNKTNLNSVYLFVCLSIRPTVRLPTSLSEHQNVCSSIGGHWGIVLFLVSFSVSREVLTSRLGLVSVKKILFSLMVSKSSFLSIYVSFFFLLSFTPSVCLSLSLPAFLSFSPSSSPLVNIEIFQETFQQKSRQQIKYDLIGM